VLTLAGDVLLRGTVTDAATASEGDGGERVLRLPVDLWGELSRSAFSYPAMLQDPRTVFSVPFAAAA
jgi:hypothetical protein